jgi:predicted SprT family Zn-dependent metalloprotease
LKLWRIQNPISISTSINSNLKKSLGSCSPSNGSIRINPSLLDDNQSPLIEVFVHELAHIAVFVLFGSSEKPHGERWQELMRQAGFEPRTSISNTHKSHLKVLSSTSTVRYRHTCPVCHSARVSPRPQPRWRCAACVKCGLEGEMIIESYVPKETVDHED